MFNGPGELTLWIALLFLNAYVRSHATSLVNPAP